MVNSAQTFHHIPDLFLHQAEPVFFLKAISNVIKATKELVLYLSPNKAQNNRRVFL